MFVSIEGVDGCGKSTQARFLEEHLRSLGREVVSTREPGGTELGERVRQLVLNGPQMAPWAEAALFAASRAEHAAEVIRPALARGADVVSDRFIDSSLAYQGIARGLGLDAVLELNLTVLEGLLPDRTFVIALDAVEAGRRREGDPDRIEREGDEFQAEVGRAYEQLAACFPERVELIAGSLRPEEVAALVQARVEDLVLSFERVLEQVEAKHLLSAALRDGPAHAYLFHGPAGVGKQLAAVAFAGELLGQPERTERRAHPDLYVLEPHGDQIRIDDVRELRHDLHMRPFEAERRVYLIFDAHLLNADAADALLKDLEEPPPYAVVVLVADELGPLPETIRSRCQLVPFRRLSERAIRAEVERLAPGLSPDEQTAVARVAAGRLDRVVRLLDPEAARRRTELLAVARAVYADPGFDPTAAAQAVLALAGERAAQAKAVAEETVSALSLPDREAEQHVKRAERGAEREEILLALEELASWYRDLVVVAAGAERAVVHYDHLSELAEDGTTDRMSGAERAAEIVRESWRTFEEFNVAPQLALEALFVRVRRELADVPAPV